jgi:O-antigen/teichoic acid export membrane protein
MVKYNSEEINNERQQKIISTAYILILVFTIFSTLIYVLFSVKLSQLLSISLNYFYIAIIFSILFVFYTLTGNTLLGMHNLKAFSALRPLYGTILLFSLMILILNNYLTFKSMLVSTFIAYILTGLVIIYLVRQHLKIVFDRYWAKTLIKYGALDIFSAVSFILYTNIDKILINKYMMVEDVGLYNAYILSSINVLTMFSSIIITVLFPTASKSNDKVSILNKIDRSIPYILLIGIPFTLIVQYMLLSLYGDSYARDSTLMILFAFTSVLLLIYQLYIWTFNSIGVEGVKITMYSSATIAIVNIILNVHLIPQFGLHGAIGATILSYMCGFSIIYINNKKINKEKMIRTSSP